MRKSLLLISALFSTAIRAEDGIGLQKFHGQAALLIDTTNADGYTIVSCTQPEGARCVGQCAEVWRDSNNIGDGVLGSRPVVRVAQQCVACERGDFFLSRNIFEQLAAINTDMYLFPVWWRCVDCGTNGDSHFGSNEQIIGETMRPRSGSRVHAALNFDNMTTDPLIEDEAIHCSLSDQTIAESSDTKVEILLVDNNDRRKGNSAGEFWSGFRSTTRGIKRENVEREKKEVFSMSTLLSSSSLNNANDASSRSPPVPPTTISSSGSSIFDGESSSGGSGSLLSSSTASEDPSYSVKTTSFDNSQDARALSTSSSLSGTTPDKNQPTTVSQYQVSDDSVDKSFSATSSVTKSPFFYASIMLGIVGSIGATVGYRAKQKRSYRDEWRAFRTFAQTSTHVCNPRLAPSSMVAVASWTRPDSHTIAIL